MLSFNKKSEVALEKEWSELKKVMVELKYKNKWQDLGEE